MFFSASPSTTDIAADDLSGTPYYILVTDLHTAVAPEVVDNKKEDKNDIGLRVSRPSKIKAVPSADGKTIDTYGDERRTGWLDGIAER